MPLFSFGRTAAQESSYDESFEHELQRNYSGGRVWDTLVSCDPCHGKEPAPGLQQAHDLLPAVHADAGGNSRHPSYYYSGGCEQVSSAAGRWKSVWNFVAIQSAAEARRNCAGFSGGRSVSWNQRLRSGAGRQYFLWA